MAKLARSLLTTSFGMLLYIGLFALSMRFIHTYPYPMPPDHQHQLFVISRTIGVRDPGDLYISTVVIVNLIAASIEYSLLLKLWRKAQRMWTHTVKL